MENGQNGQNGLMSHRDGVESWKQVYCRAARPMSMTVHAVRVRQCGSCRKTGTGAKKWRFVLRHNRIFRLYSIVEL